MNCNICYEDDLKIIYFINDKSNEFMYCHHCLEELLNTQWYNYVGGLKTDCEASLSRLIELGPPVNFRDFTIENGKEIDFFMYNNNKIDAKLKGSFDVKERDAFWSDLKLYDVNFVLEKYKL